MASVRINKGVQLLVQWRLGYYCVRNLISTNPAADNWRTVLTDTTTIAGAYIQVTVPMEEESAFYRLHALRLVNPVRANGQFQFQFYGEQGIHYRVSRSPSFERSIWQLVTEIDGTGSMMTAIDSGASPRGAY